MLSHESYPHSISTRLGAVKIYRCQNGQKIEYVVNWSIGGKRRREKFADDAQAMARANEIADNLGKAQIERASISPTEIAEYKAAREMLRGSSLLRAVEFYLESNLGMFPKTVQEVCQHLLGEIKLRCRQRHIDSTKGYHALLCEKFGDRVISTITRDELIDYLTNLKCRGHRRGQPMSGKTKNNLITALSAIWNHAKDNMNALPKNTAHMAGKLPRFMENDEKTIYSPTQMATMLDWMDWQVERGKLPPWVLWAIAIKAFTGIRTSELVELKWSDVKFDDARILCHKAVTKKSEGRIVPICPTLDTWLRLYPSARTEGKVCQGNIFSHTRKIAEGAFGPRAKWGKNALRHSFISYKMAEIGNAAVVSEMSGNSIAMVKKVYQTLAVPSDSHRYFNIKPNQKQTGGVNP
jgi:integrase